MNQAARSRRPTPSRGRRPVTARQPERLEPRLALAGVVAVAAAGDTLTITGDALANEIQIEQVAAQRPGCDEPRADTRVRQPIAERGPGPRPILLARRDGRCW